MPAHKYLQMSARAIVWSDADGEREPGGGAKMALSVAFFMYEPVSHNLSWNLSLKNAKP